MKYKIDYTIGKKAYSCKIIANTESDAMRKLKIVSAPEKIEIINIVKTDYNVQ